MFASQLDDLVETAAFRKWTGHEGLKKNANLHWLAFWIGSPPTCSELVRVNKTNAEIDADDPYAAFQIQDDLMW